MPRTKRNSIGLWWNMAALGAEAQQVMWLRMMRIAEGGKPARREAERMVSEKMLAAGEIGMKAMGGGSPASLVRAYRSKVRANRRRLAR